MSAKVQELRLDIEELNNLLQQATRQRAKDVLTVEIRRLETDLSKLLEDVTLTSMKLDQPVVNRTPKCYEVKLNYYGWDQTNNAVKLYVTLNNVHSLPKEAVVCKFTDNSIDLRIHGLENKNYHLPINNLCEEIEAEKSHFRIKTDMIIVTLIKKSSRHWSHVTGVEKRIKEARSLSIPDTTEDTDPGASLMNLMSRMYQQGDDEMKKTIAKAWTESQQRNASDFSDYLSL